MNMTGKYDQCTYLKKSPYFSFALFERNLLESPLSWQNYREKFQLLLFLEEQQMEVDIKRYNIPNPNREPATMIRDKFNKKLLVLEVSAHFLKRKKIAGSSRATVMSLR